MELIYSNHLGMYDIPENINKKTCVDIGANMGCFTEKASKIFEIVHSYEPNSFLSEEIKKKKIINVTVFNEAVIDCIQNDINLIGHTNHDSGSSAVELAIKNVIDLKHHWSDFKINTVQGIDIETVLERIGGHIDYLKMDCENSEFLILNNKDLSKIDYIGIELHHHMGEKNWNILKNHIDKTHTGFPTYPGYDSVNIECLLKNKLI